MRPLEFRLHAAAVVAPGLSSLADFRAACGNAGEAYIPTAVTLPAPSALPNNERRRASQVVRLALACIAQALESSPFPADSLRSVFATDEGTGEVSQQMLEVLATTRQVSPLLFPNSVHNAPSGYFSIAWRNTEPSNVVSLGLESFASGLLCAVTEAAATGQPVLLAAYDPAMTAPMDELLPVTEPIAAAMVITSGKVGDGLPSLGTFSCALSSAADTKPSALPAWFPQLWINHSSARALLALSLLEASRDEICRLSLGGTQLVLQRTGDATS
jgi:hypothetical protein